jgi:hypothetical protein
VANKNTLRRVKARHDAYAAHKRGRGVFPDGLAPFGKLPPVDSKPKVGASAGAIMHHLYGSRGRSV